MVVCWLLVCTFSVSWSLSTVASTSACRHPRGPTLEGEGTYGSTRLDSDGGLDIAWGPLHRGCRSLLSGRKVSPNPLLPGGTSHEVQLWRVRLDPQSTVLLNADNFWTDHCTEGYLLKGMYGSTNSNWGSDIEVFWISYWIRSLSVKR